MSLLIKAALGAAEIEPVFLVTSADAVARFQQEKFDVILVDTSGPPDSSDAGNHRKRKTKVSARPRQGRHTG
ncbi:MAG: hypothetical protein ABSA96_05905 [Candidatus Acidiferrales bacterium]